MKNIFREEWIKEYKEIIIIGAIVLGFLFYWFQLRPVSIKKNCSWVTETIPANAGITKEQAVFNKTSFDEQCGTEKSISFKCFQLKASTVERPPQSEREETNEATKNEYDQCLRQSGL